MQKTLRTPLFDKHVELKARMFSFNGYEMPLFYSSVVDEHHAVREKAGLFDVTHMGVIEVKGKDTEKFLEYLSVSKLDKKNDNSAIYTVFPNNEGGSIDDLLLFKVTPEHFYLVANASCKQKDLQHLLAHKNDFQVEIHSLFEKKGILALQGPLSKEMLVKLFKKAESLKPFKFFLDSFEGEEILISRTGYTGSLGYELMAPLPLITKLWDKLLSLDTRLKPAGLGARDTLRLEMGYALYGHELSETISPIESVSSWTVHFEKPDFLGKAAMQKLADKKRVQKGILFEAGRIPREMTPLFFEDKEIGFITSGNFSPSLNKPIAIGIFTKELEKDALIFAKLKDKKIIGKIVDLPFISVNGEKAK